MIPTLPIRRMPSGNIMFGRTLTYVFRMKVFWIVHAKTTLFPDFVQFDLEAGELLGKEMYSRYGERLEWMKIDILKNLHQINDGRQENYDFTDFLYSLFEKGSIITIEDIRREQGKWNLQLI